MTKKIENLESRVEKLEKLMRAEKILSQLNVKKEIENIKKRLEGAIFIKGPQNLKKWKEEKKTIGELKARYEGETLALTYHDGYIKLIAHAPTIEELMTRVGEAFASNGIPKDALIFFK